MKPINLQGHSRPIKKVKFNESGDLLFTASSDRTIVSWSIPMGEKLKTYNHSAAINTFCVTNKHLISGDNTGTIYIWEISSEKILKKLEHDPTLSVRSLDVLPNDQSQIMVVYAGRAKLAKSFISIYNINDILDYGETKTEEKKSASLIDVTAEALKEMKKLSLPDDDKKENETTNEANGNAATTTTNIKTANSTNVESSENSVISANNNSNNNSIYGNLNQSNNNNTIQNQQKTKPAFTPGKSIYDEENSIYSIYANKPKESFNNNNINNQNSNYKFANQNNYNNNNNNNNYQNNFYGNQYGNQQQQQGYNFNNNNNNGNFYNQNQQMGQGQQQGNYRFNNISNNNNNNNFNNRNNNYNNQYQNNNMQNNYNNNNNGGSMYNINNNFQNQNMQNMQNTGGFQRSLNSNQTSNLFNPLKGNSFDPNPSIIQRAQIDNSAKITVSFEKIIPMKQIEIPSTANTKYVMAKFFTYNDILCIAVAKENGLFEFINYVSSKTIHEEKLHNEIIFDFDYDASEKLFLTVSKDGTACVFDFEKYKIIKTFKPENPVRFLNTCKIYKLDKNFMETVDDIKNGVRKLTADKLFGNDDVNENLNPLDRFVFVIAGGQDSKLVTTTKEGGFEIIGFNMEMEESIFMHLANFGPVNTLDLSKKNNYFVSGSEDSSVKLLNFDQLLISNANGK